MKISKILSALAVTAPLAFAASQADAVAFSGTGTGAFSGLSGCDTSGGNKDCGLNGSTQVLWGSEYASVDFWNASSLTAVAQNFSGNTTAAAQTVNLARIDWFNSSTPSSLTPGNFSVAYTLTVAFSQPFGSLGDTELFSLNISNTSNPPGDLLTGFYLSDLSNLVFSLNGITVNNFRYEAADGNGDCTGTDYSFDNTKWYNCEDNKSSLYVKADFTNVASVPVEAPEPMTLGLLGLGLAGVGFARRRTLKA